MQASGAGGISAWKIVLAIGLALGSAIAAGLTLGLLTLDLLQLRILISCGEAENASEKAIKSAKHARTILRVRKRGNLLLITLLIVNVATNAGFSIMMGDATSGLTGFFISTAIITVFGEILPQAICARYGLLICCRFVPVIILVEILLCPIAFPLAWLLDKILGQDLGITYTREQLSLLLEHHQKEAKILQADEVLILGGGLMIHKKRARDAMTKMEDVVGLLADEVLSVTSLGALFSSGFSRIPIFLDSGGGERNQQRMTLSTSAGGMAIKASSPEGSAKRPLTSRRSTNPTTNSRKVVGFIFVKDLLLLKGVERISCKDLLLLFHNKTIVVDEAVPLLTLLNFFKAGQSHIAVVASSQPERNHIGIITLEDIIEEILQDEIQDEYDYPSHHQQQLLDKAQLFTCKDLLNSDKDSKSGVPLSQSYIQRQKNPSVEMDRRSAIMRLFHSHPGERNLDIVESKVLLKFLKTSYPSLFGTSKLPTPNGLHFLSTCTLVEFDDEVPIPDQQNIAWLVLQGSIKEQHEIHGALKLVNFTILQDAVQTCGGNIPEPRYKLTSGSSGCVAVQLNAKEYLAAKTEIISDLSYFSSNPIAGDTSSIAITEIPNVLEIPFTPGSTRNSVV